MRCMQPFIPELLAFPSVDQCLIEAGVSELEDPVSLNCDSKLPKETGKCLHFLEGSKHGDMSLATSTI